MMIVTLAFLLLQYLYVARLYFTYMPIYLSTSFYLTNLLKNCIYSTYFCNISRLSKYKIKI